ncbi:hypothetical protein VHA01S_030_00600 [Vibrio halioticoli NBRC 102217]|uniref:Uncharacterized protein n=1 Tax=Vibrio halioticoli NBRC 102217 TaxID=1219072 RepID=V5HLC2_9VIBR|nr:hypothetical protein VHA01S_030_00600 [Vibrio halioticoli NBRC 102217]
MFEFQTQTAVIERQHFAREALTASLCDEVNLIPYSTEEAKDIIHFLWNNLVELED